MESLDRLEPSHRMKKTFGLIVLWMVLLASFGYSLATKYGTLPDASVRLAAIPTILANFSSRDVPLTAVEVEVYGSIHVLKRICVLGGQQAQLLCLDGTRDRHAVHDPRLCFRGAGWEILQDEPMPHPAGGEVRRLRLRKAGHEVETLYWWSTLHERHGSPGRYWLQTALRRITRGLSGDEPVLVLLQPLHAERLVWSTWIAPHSPLHSL